MPFTFRFARSAPGLRLRIPLLPGKPGRGCRFVAIALIARPLEVLQHRFVKARIVTTLVIDKSACAPIAGQ